MSQSEVEGLTMQASGPLAGTVIADFSRVLAGPYATMLLADLGATVIKVESPDGDDTRQWVPPVRNGISTYYMSVNRNKHSITLDLKNEADLEVAYQIIDRADVFIENWKPGGLKKFGLDPESVTRRWPHIVHSSITGFGSAGGASMPGYDLLAQALSGMMEITGSPDGPPQRSGVAVFDVMTGMHAAIGILAALQERRTSGHGQHLEVNLLSSAISSLVNQTAGYAAAGNVPTRQGNDHPSLFPYGPFKAKDRDLVITCGNDNQFGRLMEQLGCPEVAADPRFLTMKDRNTNRETLREIIEAQLGQDTAKAWFDKLQAVQVPCAPILGIDGGIEFATSIGLEPVVNAGTGDDTVPSIRNPINFSRTEVTYDKAPADSRGRLRSCTTMADSVSGETRNPELCLTLSKFKLLQRPSRCNCGGQIRTSMGTSIMFRS